MLARQHVRRRRLPSDRLRGLRYGRSGSRSGRGGGCRRATITRTAPCCVFPFVPGEGVPHPVVEGVRPFSAPELVPSLRARGASVPGHRARRRATSAPTASSPPGRSRVRPRPSSVSVATMTDASPPAGRRTRRLAVHARSRYGRSSTASLAITWAHPPAPPVQAHSCSSSSGGGSASSQKPRGRAPHAPHHPRRQPSRDGGRAQRASCGG